MRKKLILKGACVAACVSLLLTFNYVLFHVFVGYRVHLVPVFLAARDIMPREKIKAEDLIEVKIPEAYVLDHACTKKTEIIGRYTDIQGKIPAGSPFYRSMLKSEEEMYDQPVTQLKEGQTVYTLETSMTKLGTVLAGMRVDVHVTIAGRNEPVRSGAILNHVRVISVRDHKGAEINDENSSGVPYMVLLAVNRDDLDLLAKAEAAGEIRLFPAGRAYDSEAEAVRCDNEITAYILQEDDGEEVFNPSEAVMIPEIVSEDAPDDSRTDPEMTDIPIDPEQPAEEYPEVTGEEETMTEAGE